MKLISSSYVRFYRIICLLLALHLLNISIDPRDRQSDEIPEDLSINDIESFTEFFAEIVFGWQDAFQEHDEKDRDDGSCPDFYKFYCSNQSVTITPLTFRHPMCRKFHIRNADAILAPVKDIDSPPPRG